MPPFKLIFGLSSTLATLSIIAIPLWVLGIPGVQNSFARGWKMGLGVLIGYPPACALVYLPLRAMNSRLASDAREDWQSRTSVVALLIFLIAAARMVQAWRRMLDQSAS